MKKVMVEIGKDGLTVSSIGDDGSQLSFEWETTLLLTPAIDEMVVAGLPEEVIIKIVKQVYDKRLRLLK